MSHTASVEVAAAWRRVSSARLRATLPPPGKSRGARVLMVSHGSHLAGGAEFVFRDMVVALHEKRPSDLDKIALYHRAGPLAADAARLGVQTKSAWIPW